MPLPMVNNLTENIADRLSAMAQGKTFLTQADVEQRIAEDNWDFSNCVMKDVDFSKIPDIGHKITSKCLEKETMDFSNSTLKNVSFENVPYLNQVNLQYENAQLNNVSFKGEKDLIMTLKNTQLTDCNLEDAGLKSRDTMTGVSTIYSVEFKNCSMKNMDFQNQSIRNATIDGCDLENASINHITNSNIKNSNMQNVKIQPYKPYEQAPESERLRPQIEQTTFENCDMSGIQINDADIYKTKFDENNMEHANLDDTHIHDKTSFRHTNLTSASMDNLEAKNVDLTGAILNNAQITNADLTHAKLNAAHTKETNFTGTIAPNAEMHDLYGNRPTTEPETDVTKAFAQGASTVANQKQESVTTKTNQDVTTTTPQNDTMTL